jgi:hypothetical protein
MTTAKIQEEMTGLASSNTSAEMAPGAGYPRRATALMAALQD